MSSPPLDRKMVDRPLIWMRRAISKSMRISQASAVVLNVTPPSTTASVEVPSRCASPSHWNTEVEPGGEYGLSPYNAWPGHAVHSYGPSLSE
eukprot:3114002-Rhodomonas_salina.1